MSLSGLETVAVSACPVSELENADEAGAAFSGAVVARAADSDAELADVIQCWPGLSEDVRKAVHCMVVEAAAITP